jgi:hypothetical protein
MECLKECLKHLAFLRRRRIRNLHIPAIPGIWETGRGSKSVFLRYTDELIRPAFSGIINMECESM